MQMLINLLGNCLQFVQFVQFVELMRINEKQTVKRA